MNLKITFAAMAIATFLAPGSVTYSHAEEQVEKTVTCKSFADSRTSCAVRGEIISAGVSRQFGDGVPCFLGFNWGFEEKGIWTANGCSAEFALTVVRAERKKAADPKVLRDRLKNSRQKLRESNQALAQQEEARRSLEAELAETQDALRAAAAAAPKTVKKKFKPQMAVRSVAVCSNRAVAHSRKSGMTNPRVVEILSARQTQGSWLVIGRMAAEASGERSSSFFRCWTREGEILSYSNEI